MLPLRELGFEALREGNVTPLTILNHARHPPMGTALTWGLPKPTRKGFRRPKDRQSGTAPVERASHPCARSTGDRRKKNATAHSLAPK